METKQWPSNYQQSVPPATTVSERTATNTTIKSQPDSSTVNNNIVTTVSIKNEEQVENSSTTPKNSSPVDAGNESNDSLQIQPLYISEEAKQTIHILLEQIKSLSPIEQYYLYLKLPLQISEIDPFRQPLNPLGSRSEIHRTISWIRTHLEEDPDVSLPKQEVYEEYCQFCVRIKMKALSQADFGKVMKQVYPKVRARRLGNRGKSRYCYSGLRRYVSLKPPLLPDLADKPMSSEAPCTQSNLTSAAWLIVRDWSQQQLGIQFASLQTLAYYLILNNSIGVGTEAANKLKAVADSQLKEENKNGNKHREMQLQLQRKIQQKNEVNKERKRKMQSPKCEMKTPSKKTKNSGKVKQDSLVVSNEISSDGSTNAINTNQGKQICDKSIDFTKQQQQTQQLPTLPDFNSFQKPTTTVDIGNIQTKPTTPVFGGESNTTVYKVAIPRIPTQVSPPNTKKQPKPANNVKYKAIQPKLQEQPQQNNRCDIALYNQQPIVLAADNRSQNTEYNLDRIKERKVCDKIDNSPTVQNGEVCNVNVDFPLTRERINSISNVDKDAMDEYLGTNNSQHEEEICKYFPNNNNTIKEQSSTNDATKLSALRQLLEQNLIDNPQQLLHTTNTPIQEQTTNVTTKVPRLQQQHSYPQSTIAIPQSVLPSQQIRRRVSFETPTEETVVPPSPNTRRKNFSFTPISPIIDPQSPATTTATQSKCSSRNVSPFVSPRNTPVQRTKTGTKRGDIEAQSAPVSPMLKQLLNAGNNIGRFKLLPIDTTSTEVSQFFVNTTTQTPSSIENLAYTRSQSVPLNHHIDTSAFLSEMTNTHINDFNELDPIMDADTDNVKRILNEMDEQQLSNCDNNNVDLFNAVDVNELLNSNLIYNAPTNLLQMEQQQQQLKLSINHFRSVPNTPLSFTQPNAINDFLQTTSRSYPSTPVVQTNNNFTINLNNSDCLINGQPIQHGDGTLANSDNNIEIESKTFNCIEDDGEFGPFEHTNELIDENCVLIDQNYDNI